ncbi:RING-H2 finger protein ATL14-like [Abrus precatorius]|uniref:RING-type E3 ubiquitin transferase n=1 Tax=Abrus precatorius TaxID=3816 RepID=A0A8B8K2Q2_ABRPR|nr:RING-H2 finger protein ATL14-like [Abrus precatorius]
MEIVISLIMLLVGIAVLVVIHVCIVGRAFRRDNNNHGHGESTQGQSSGTMKTMFGENIGDLKNLPCFDYEEPEKGCSQVDCAVCLEKFKVGDVCRLLPNCSHSFHVQCIDLWILKTPFCPICRTWVHSRVMVPSVLREESAVSDRVELQMA